MSIQPKLAAVTRAILADAHSDAERLLGEARAAARAASEQAQSEGANALERARKEGASEAERLLAAERARARREARALVLAAQREACQTFQAQAIAAARALRATPAYPVLLARLEELAREQLGAEATLRVDPDGEVGLVAVSGARSVDYRLTEIALRELAASAAEIEELWS